MKQANFIEGDQDGRVVKALDLRSNGRAVRVGSTPTPGRFFFKYQNTAEAARRDLMEDYQEFHLLLSQTKMILCAS